MLRQSELGILKKETPITEKPEKKTVYMIEDNFFRFWYRFVPGNMSAIHAGRMEQVYEQAVKNTIRIIWGCGSKGRSYAADDGGSLPVAAVRQGVRVKNKVDFWAHLYKGS